MQWLRTFVYEMTGTIRKPTSGAYPFGTDHPLVPSTSEEDETHVEAVEQCVHRYYCSQFTQTALSATTRRNVNEGTPLRLPKSTERLCSECSPAVRERWTRREGARAAVPGDVW
ncbi:hypothetical protein GQ600_15078 [Phytophthora cactorum]|nr:hypothetical protein GQ600_15078 [Phytophthora cactorum]